MTHEIHKLASLVAYCEAIGAWVLADVFRRELKLLIKEVFSETD